MIGNMSATYYSELASRVFVGNSGENIAHRESAECQANDRSNRYCMSSWVLSWSLR